MDSLPPTVLPQLNTYNKKILFSNESFNIRNQLRTLANATKNKLTSPTIHSSAKNIQPLNTKPTEPQKPLNTKPTEPQKPVEPLANKEVEDPLREKRRKLRKQLIKEPLKELIKEFYDHSLTRQITKEISSPHQMSLPSRPYHPVVREETPVVVMNSKDIVEPPYLQQPLPYRAFHKETVTISKNPVKQRLPSVVREETPVVVMNSKDIVKPPYLQQPLSYKEFHQQENISIPSLITDDPSIQKYLKRQKKKPSILQPHLLVSFQKDIIVPPLRVLEETVPEPYKKAESPRESILQPPAFKKIPAETPPILKDDSDVIIQNPTSMSSRETPPQIPISDQEAILESDV